MLTPIKFKSARHSLNKREQKPGAATKRPGEGPVRRTLHRALSTEQFHRRSVSRGPGNAIALMRSASSTSVSGVKREGSEPPSLNDLPRGEVDRKRQPSLARSSSSSQASSEGFKANKKAMVEAELKDAISALRKPNREVVGKAMAEADKRRAGTGLAGRSEYSPDNNQGVS